MRIKDLITIQNTFTLTVSYEQAEPFSNMDNVETYLNTLFNSTISVDNFMGNPACSPYIQIVTEDKLQLIKIGENLVNNLKKDNCKVFA